jgi:hypothetical protein
MVDGYQYESPAGYGIIHDPDGESLPKCDVFIGPFKKSRRPAEMTRAAKAYFGSKYPGLQGSVNVPIDGPWTPIGETNQIWYRRGVDGRPALAKAPYYHPFYKRGRKAKALILHRGPRGFLWLSLPSGCILNERGFVWP